MALIKCPECGKEISSKAAWCPHCGCPSSEFSTDQGVKCPYCGANLTSGDNYCDSCGKRVTPYSAAKNESQNLPDYPYTICPECGSTNPSGKFTCEKCGHKFNFDDYHVTIPWEADDFDGVYRSTLFGGLEKVYCPRCHSSNCSHYQEQRIVPAKTKTRYSVNLNPLHPFTLVNKKEKVVKNGYTVSENKFVCNKCGKIFG